MDGSPDGPDAAAEEPRIARGRRLAGRPAVHVTSATTASTVLIHLPLFLLGGLVVLIRDDVPGLDEAMLGVAVSAFFGVSMLTSVIGGRVAERRGPRFGLVVAALLSALSLLVLGTATTLAGVIAASALGGAANGIGQTASNLGLARGVNLRRQGFAFGIKQASVPIAGLLAGFSVPLIGLTFGWRWTFAAAGLLVVGVIALVPRNFGPPAPRRIDGGKATDAPRPVLLLLAAGAGFGSAAANSLGAFVVLTAVAYGVGTGSAGYLLALGSAGGVAARLITGWRADRRGQNHLPVVAGMLSVGVVGYLLLAVGWLHPAVLVVAVVVAFVSGWGWPGLLAFAVVRLHPGMPGIASGVVLAGAMAGAVTGPLLFGLVASRGTFPVAWLAAAMSSAVAAVLVVIARRTVWGAIVAGRMERPPSRVGGQVRRTRH